MPITLPASLFSRTNPWFMSTGPVAAFRLKRWPEAVADAGKVLKEKPDRLRALYYRARAHQQLSRHAEAVADFSALLCSYPRDTKLYDLRATSYESLGEKAKAQADHQKATEVAQDDANQLNKRAWGAAH